MKEETIISGISEGRVPHPCDEHWQNFAALNPDSVFVLSEETRNEECEYCRIERLSNSGGNEFKRCTKCKDGIVVHQSRNVERVHGLGHDFREPAATYLSPTIEICTRGCSHRIDNGKWIEGEEI
jgi:uncharacterized protein with PIN domain